MTAFTSSIGAQIGCSGATATVPSASPLGGALSNTLGDVTLSSTGVVLGGVLAKTLDAVTLAATGTLPISGDVAKTLGAVTLAATGAFPPGEYVFTNSYADIVDRTTYSFTTVDIGTANANRVVAITAGWGQASARTISSATINGVTATVAAQDSTGLRGAGIIYAVVPTGTTNVTVSITLSGAATRMVIGSYQFIPVSSSTPIDTASTGTATNTDVSAAIDVQAGGVVIWCSAHGSDTGTLTASYDGVDSATLHYDTVVEVAGDYAGAAAGVAETTTRNTGFHIASGNTTVRSLAAASWH